MKNITIENLAHMQEVAEKLLRNFSAEKKTDSATVVALSGDLGSGKTTFTQCIGAKLGITENIHSPTFVVSKIYTIPKHSEFFALWKNMIHIDAYRLEGKNESKNIGLSEQIQNSENIIFIEWPEMIEKELPKNMIRLNFEYVSENERAVSILL